MALRIPFDNLSIFDIYAAQAQLTDWEGRRALYLENGGALLRDPLIATGSQAVDIWCPGPAYPGLAFHARDPENFELVYVQPHTSGQWDAVQYDPVFNGSNTWQLHCGSPYQGVATVPGGQWLTLQVQIMQGGLAAWVWPASENGGQALTAPPALLVPQRSHR